MAVPLIQGYLIDNVDPVWFLNVSLIILIGAMVMFGILYTYARGRGGMHTGSSKLLLLPSDDTDDDNTALVLRDITSETDADEASLADPY